MISNIPGMIIKKRFLSLVSSAVAISGLLAWADAYPDKVLTGKAAFSDVITQKPGLFRKLTPADLPAPYATSSVSGFPRVVARPAGALPQALPGFVVNLYASDLKTPRALKRAPNGDVFLAENGSSQIRVYRGIGSDGKSATESVFATGVGTVFGMAFYPPGDDPKWLYVSNMTTVYRFGYSRNDLTATGKPETIISGIPGGGHVTRDLAFSRDGKSLFVAIGSQSNVNDPDERPAEKNRANVLEYTPDGKFVRVYGGGIRNPVGLAVNPTTGELWCSVNERDGLGDNLVPDYITHIEPGGFYGWPWFYIGGNQDPRLAGKHPELKDKVIVPDVLLQPHFASLQMMFYEGTQFPAEYKGDIFAAQHGSWNRSVRTGYEVIRVQLKNSKANGTYEDFLTGFVLENGEVWGRPVGVAAASDGSLLVSDDGSGSIWRVSRSK
uniref:NHL repeat containing protein n=1 Tax=Solibacter usitatus (strain Ellin6076) TaxID=234267 RepID=Q023F3_SOLUE